MGKRGDRKRLMRSLKRTAKRIPLGAEHLPKWLKSHFPHIYAQHVAHRMINGKQRNGEYVTDKMAQTWTNAWRRNAQANLEAAMRLYQNPPPVHPNCKCLVVPPHLKDKAEALIGRS